jgi:hypothetical protein
MTGPYTVTLDRLAQEEARVTVINTLEAAYGL